MSGRQFAATFCLLLTGAIGGNLALVIVATAPPTEAIELLLVTGGEDPTSERLARGAEAAARRHGVALRTCRLDAASPAAILRDLDAGKIDGVILGGNSPTLAARFHHLASQPKVITCGQDGSPDCWHHVGAGAHSSGRICADFLESALPPGSPIIVLVDDAAAPTVANRLAGFQERLRPSLPFPGRAPIHPVVACLEDFGQIAACIDNARRAVESHPRAACLVDLGDRCQDAAVRRLASLARTAGVALVTFDDSEAALAAVERGDVLAVMADDPYGQGFQAVDRLSMYCRGSELALPAAGRGSVNVPVRVIRRATAATAAPPPLSQEGARGGIPLGNTGARPS